MLMKRTNDVRAEAHDTSGYQAETFVSEVEIIDPDRVSYDGKTVDYRSIAEIDRAIEVLDREIATAEGRKIIRQVRVITTKGL